MSNDDDRAPFQPSRAGSPAQDEKNFFDETLTMRGQPVQRVQTPRYATEQEPINNGHPGWVWATVLMFILLNITGLYMGWFSVLGFVAMWLLAAIVIVTYWMHRN